MSLAGPGVAAAALHSRRNAEQPAVSRTSVMERMRYLQPEIATSRVGNQFMKPFYSSDGGVTSTAATAQRRNGVSTRVAAEVTRRISSAGFWEIIGGVDRGVTPY